MGIDGTTSRAEAEDQLFYIHGDLLYINLTLQTKEILPSHTSPDLLSIIPLK